MSLRYKVLAILMMPAEDLDDYIICFCAKRLEQQLGR